MQLPNDFLTRMREQLGGAFGAYQAAMERTPVRALRVNTLKTSVDAFLQRAPFSLSPSGLAEESFLLHSDEKKIGSHPLHRAGHFYMQEPSAARPVELLNIQPGMRVLDLCAAPGGKSTQIAAKMQGSGILVANEPVSARASALADNIERMGVENAIVTSMLPAALASFFNGYFDAILVDAPCSGEGMFRKEPRAIADWSIKHVQACALRQRQILDCAAPMLKPGGQIVYSTCTFSREENEDTVRGFLQANPILKLVSEERHYPHTGPGEGQYAALLQNTDEPRDGSSRPVPPKKDKTQAEATHIFSAFAAAYLTIVPNGKPMLLKDNRLMLMPKDLDLPLANLHVKSAGVFAGEVQNGRFIPSHGLGLSSARYKQTLAIEGSALQAYLHGETLPIKEEYKGCTAVETEGLYMGLGRAVDGTLKNLLPKGLRVR